MHRKGSVLLLIVVTVALLLVVGVLVFLKINPNSRSKIGESVSPQKTEFATDWAKPKNSQEYRVTLDPMCGDMNSIKILNSIDEALKDPEAACGLSFHGDCPNPFPAEIKKLVNLNYLSLNQTACKSLSPEIGELKNLRVLSLPWNYFGVTEMAKDGYNVRFPSEIKKLTKLQSLNLQGSLLTEFPKEILNLENLIELDVSSNRISEIPKEINRLTKLQNFDVSANYLIAFPDEMKELKHLKVIDIGVNKLSGSTIDKLIKMHPQARFFTSDSDHNESIDAIKKSQYSGDDNWTNHTSE